jgi:hypothetical protein
MQRIENRKQRTVGFFIFGLAVFLFSFCPLASADKIYLKDGKVYEGKVTGKSDRRYLFALNLDGDLIPISFFIDQVDKVELSKDTVATQIPYLKEVDSAKVPVKEGTDKVYELSLYNKNQKPSMAADLPFTEVDIKKLLSKEEREYYREYNQVAQRYADKLVEVQDAYANLPSATKADFVRISQSMDDLYFELNGIAAPPAFKSYHASCLESVKATYLAFKALEKSLLEDALRQIKISEESKARSISLFRRLIEDRRSAVPKKEP